MLDATPKALSGLTIALFESRYGDELSRLVTKQGGTPLGAPAIVEAQLALGPEQVAFAEALRAGSLDGVLVLTGVGQRKIADVLAPIMSREELRDLLAAVVVAARGPKAVGALKELGVRPQVVAPEPHTWQDLVQALAAHMDLAGKRFALQQYGVPHEKLTAALEERGASVLQVPVYRWEWPADLSRLTAQIEAIIRGEVDAVLFTAGPQAGVMVELSRQIGVERELRVALGRSAIGSVGPSCTEALRNLDLVPDFEPEHGKMGHLVLEAARQVRAVLSQKRR